MFAVVLILSALLLALTNAIAFRSRSAAPAGGAACVWLLLGFCVFSPVLLLNAASVAVVGFVCAARNAKPSRFLAYSLAVTLLSYGIVSAYSLAVLNDLSNRYAVASMDERLSYEDAARRGPLREAAPARPDSDLVELLEFEIEKEHKGWRHGDRPLALKQLHERTVQAFAASPGFGVARGVPSLHYAVTLPEIPTIPQPTPSLATAADQPPFEVLRPDDVLGLHWRSMLSFVNAPGFGYVAGRRQAVGFQEHHFRAESDWAEWHGLLDAWRVRRVELVSLLRHSEPRVYLSDNLPRMDELRKAKTRPLDGFEASALPDLLKGGDLAAGRTGDSVRVLGAIRAAKQCLDCHSVERGELLGAFSYRLRLEADGR
jgi:hypothetical protein